MQNHQLLWPQVIDKPAEADNVLIRYGVEAYPTKFILDKDKKIIARFVGEGGDFYKMMDELMATN